MKIKLRSKLFILIGVVIINFNSCNSQVIPKEFNNYITKISQPVDYKAIIANYGNDKNAIPFRLSKDEAIEDIQMFQYLLSTSYAGFEYWEQKGLDFNSYFDDLNDFINEKDSVLIADFEIELSKILKQIYDGHIALIGSGYNHAYRHKAIYYCDIIVEKTENGLFKVIDSQVDKVKTGDIFTQKDHNQYLFRTLSPPGKNHCLIGSLSFNVIASRALSFNDKTIQVPFHKSSLLYAKFNDPKPFYIERKDNIPVIRVASFENRLYPDMKKFMELGNELKNENTIIVNLFYNGGGSSVFPQTFIQNLNGKSEWEMSWAMLTSPAITQYFANYDLSSIPDISSEFKNLIRTNSEKNEEYRTSPVKNWEFGSSQEQNVTGSYNGTFIILTNRRVLSAGEAMVGYSKSIHNRIIIGENTGGVAQFSDACEYYLPNSKFIARLPRQFLFIPDLEECIGFQPDYWLDSMEPEKEILRWINNPENYQFKFSCSYDEMLANNKLATVLPDDVMIIPPGLKVPETLREFSGKWFGVTDGILDHLLVVEKINDNLEVDAIFSWGVAYQWNIYEPGWQRFKGKIENQKLILSDKNNQMKITYEFNTEGTLNATYERPGILSYTTLTQLNK
jgi:hypothetical protein